MFFARLSYKKPESRLLDLGSAGRKKHNLKRMYVLLMLLCLPCDVSGLNEKQMLAL